MSTFSYYFWGIAPIFIIGLFFWGVGFLRRRK